ncbi:MAG: DUF4388 domain-containing protein [Myxococcaceae bacterium]|nr:DUF4388 domain-containing protein [Myxococcaceae bacterium]
MSRFLLDRGRLEPLDDEARSALAARNGEYFLAPTVPDLLWLVRTTPGGGKPPAPRVVLAGDASGFPLSDLIAFLSQSRWTGAVRVHSATGQRAIALKDGEIRGATSDSPSDRLGEAMVRLGFLTRAKLEEVMRDHPPSRLGRALVEKGILQAHEVWNCITHQVSEIFHAIVLCREGTFFLVDQEPEDKSTQNVQLSMQSLLMDSIRKVDELAHFRKRIPHGRMYVAMKQLSDGRLEPEEDRVLSLCDGQRTVLEIGALARLGEFDATKIIYRLLEGGYAQVSDHPIPVQGTPLSDTGGHPAPAVPSVARTLPSVRTPPSRDAAAVLAIFNQIFQEIRAEVAKQEMDRELIAAANAALSGNALSQSPVLHGVLFDRDGVLPKDKVLAQYEKVKGELGSEPVASLRQALSDVMFFLLFQAGELLESRQDEALARRVKELLAPLDEA